MTAPQLHYISHGAQETGGYHHELTLVYALEQELSTTTNVHRYKANISGLLGVCKLWWYAFKHAGKGVNITVQRLAFPVWLKSLLLGSKVLVVFHHYDEREQRSVFHQLQFSLLQLLARLSLTNFKLVVVAPFWKQFFIEHAVKPEAILYFPNLFDTRHYLQYSNVATKTNIVYLGQFGEKQDEDVFKLAAWLHKAGYTPVFSSLNQEVVHQHENYEVRCLSKEEYQKLIASAYCTVCLSRFNEGWNRTAHESLLLGTPVIGNDAGGLGDLLKEANQLRVKQAEKAFHKITEGISLQLPDTFTHRYDISQIPYYAKPIVEFCNNGIS